MKVYMQRVINVGTVSEYKPCVEYWSFENKGSLNFALANEVSCNRITLAEVQDRSKIKTFDHFLEIGNKTSFLRLVELIV